jgi:hypothetical protein
MENFIIRIYRREFSDISGLVEQVEMNEQRPFACFDELRDILSLRAGKARWPEKSMAGKRRKG